VKKIGLELLSVITGITERVSGALRANHTKRDSVVSGGGTMTKKSESDVAGSFGVADNFWDNKEKLLDIYISAERDRKGIEIELSMKGRQALESFILGETLSEKKRIVYVLVTAKNESKEEFELAYESAKEVQNALREKKIKALRVKPVIGDNITRRLILFTCKDKSKEEDENT